MHYGYGTLRSPHEEGVAGRATQSELSGEGPETETAAVAARSGRTMSQRDYATDGGGQSREGKSRRSVGECMGSSEPPLL